VALVTLVAVGWPAVPFRSAPSTLSAAPKDVCVIDDPRARELSGLVAVTSGYVAVTDSQFDATKVRIVYLDARCRVSRTAGFPTAPRDPEDLAVAPDGSVWVADIGDNETASTRRQTIALWRIPARGAPVIHRLTYPDGPHDAEALLFGADGLPVVVTKETNGRARLYRPTTPLAPNTATGVPMVAAGEFHARGTGENNFLGGLGEVLVTGAAVSPDRRRVVLRTYTAAYEWDVPDGDIVKAITTGTPRVTALPDEPQGEAIAYSSDGTAFLTMSDQPGPTTLRSHVPSTSTLVTVPPSSPAVAIPPARPKEPSGLPLWLSIAAGLAGLGLAAAGYLGLRHARARQTSADPS
jgi:hypothetical protein